jgi:hypothetical protein
MTYGVYCYDNSGWTVIPVEFSAALSGQIIVDENETLRMGIGDGLIRAAESQTLWQNSDPDLPKISYGIAAVDDNNVKWFCSTGGNLWSFDESVSRKWPQYTVPYNSNLFILDRKNRIGMYDSQKKVSCVSKVKHGRNLRNRTESICRR